MNGLELKFLWSIPIVGRHVPTKGNLKIHYFMASIFMQIGGFFVRSLLDIEDDFGFIFLVKFDHHQVLTNGQILFYFSS